MATTYAAIGRQGNEDEIAIHTLRSLANVILGKTGKPSRLDSRNPHGVIVHAQRMLDDGAYDWPASRAALEKNPC